MASIATNLRLSCAEQEGIRRAVERACEQLGVVWRRIVLFGSRTDPARRGGDIDLLVELDPHRLTQRLRIALEDEIGVQRVDLVVDDGSGAGAFPALARLGGVELWSNS
ncbi:MAG: nucleotidyltransferase domain-containing protein [Planctomycetia bacterium]|nr:nucleotidyltransferase domain-containing protein [Planctomycetia bacterium]